MRHPTEEGTFSCDNCDMRASTMYMEDWNDPSRTYFSHYKIYAVGDGRRHYCGTCRQCRGCRASLKVNEIYRPIPVIPISGGNNCGKHSSLCLKCLDEKKRFTNKLDNTIERMFTETTGKPLKNLLRLSTQDFKLQEFAELKHDDGRTIQVGWYYDSIHGGTYRISQFQKTLKFNSKGKEIPNRFDRRGKIKLNTERYRERPDGIGVNNLLAFTTHAPSHCRHYIHQCRAIGYRLTIIKNNGRIAFLNPILRKTLWEERGEARRREIDAELGNMVRSDHDKIEKRYKERRRTNLDWVEEYIPKGKQGE